MLSFRSLRDFRLLDAKRMARVAIGTLVKRPSRDSRTMPPPVSANSKSLTMLLRSINALNLLLAFLVLAAMFCSMTELSAAETAPAKTANSATHAGVPTVLLTDDDWRRVPRTTVSSQRVDELIDAAIETSTRGHSLAPPTTDEQFLRRVFLDLTGTLPTPAQQLAFATETDPQKRAKEIDRLLDSDAYARHWARFWRDVVTARLTNRRSMGLTRSFEEWLFERFRSRDDWRTTTRAILTAEGELRFTLNTPSPLNGELFFLVAHDGPEAEERAAETSRVFLGIQIQCAQCHDHPSENWKRAQFHEFAAYFARIKYEQLFDKGKLSGVQLVKLDKAEHKVQSLKNPDEYSLAHPRFLDGRKPGEQLDDRERRQALADAVTGDDNYWFAAAHVNRIWNEMTGHSFYPHVDDLGPMKEVTLPEVLMALVGSFQASGYDTRSLIRTIANTATYQRQLAIQSPDKPQVPYLGAFSKRLRADTLWDALIHVFGKIEPGARFHTGSGVRFNGSFLEGKFRTEFDFDPSLDRDEVNGTIPQALFLINNLTLSKHLNAAKTSVVGHVLREYPDNAAAVDHLFRLTLARTPSERERVRCLAYIADSSSREVAYEDLLWALINSTEFQRTR